ncbi:unnamed protein product [Didymodactylos carnosus]|uniref:Uncharacterized protein n=1 Tax=Didymodactylos carnosus TaxID=1234261 RepID=A0A814LAG4_9BILA|nr:unnamed protein product [Didymodactylos carnosus]CAF1063150.1 unnamed protein product [Didymodactylos carnosus]CAF3746804.1 unnamed protein product [Didymodactylos carnosus]CAF3831196.1 unnamed protein product [Didymodactylos carnosus]
MASNSSRNDNLDLNRILSKSLRDMFENSSETSLGYRVLAMTNVNDWDKFEKDMNKNCLALNAKLDYDHSSIDSASSSELCSSASQITLAPSTYFDALKPLTCDSQASILSSSQHVQQQQGTLSFEYSQSDSSTEYFDRLGKCGSSQQSHEHPKSPFSQLVNYFPFTQDTTANQPPKSDFDRLGEL